MPKTMIERVAREICKLEWRDPDEVCIGEGHASGQTWLGWQVYVAESRAIIEAMREPTEGMRSAWLGSGRESVTAARDWNAMIDAALAEKPGFDPTR
ncbi:hypothetical protein [Sphingomonas immobilis]|uniref:Uncharacterized protein n=1 Tax=Sphingomonas immobilis TaxID=3063997 RepID=A0ABT8ZX49_9SPHN|nr:hypothetical protein [Sphingomonas sp. CA1-15]MDO7841057.1 hypothetical protein [Sphingomonas sp. CA1-15]